jgi:mycofactocin system FadH/OYE family oxidoreductase 2
MEDQFKFLFTPLKVGSVTISNRIFCPPHGTMMPENNLPSERLAYYHAEKAKGGVGLIVTEGTLVHETGQANKDMIFGFDKRCVPGFKRIADMVHAHGTKIFGQLLHHGRQMESLHSRLPVWGPSPIPSPVTREIPHEMSHEEIQEVIQGFAKVAANLKEAGYDGVEIHGAHGYLVTQFMSPLSNQRQDEYGGSFENRLRFPLEVIEAVRMEVGREFVVGIRISGDELVPGGLTLDDMKQIAPRLEATGMLDYISVIVGNYSTRHLMIGDMSVPLGAVVYLAAGIKEVVNLPVFTAMRIKDPLQAEKILADGYADMVGMCRALITDPGLPRKAKEGRLEDIRNCIACNQECRTHSMGRMISCIQNPSVGFEKELGTGTLKVATKRKEVVIIGGGPAGMEAGRVAALRGHHVTIYERNGELGGQVNIASKIPTRNEFGDVVRYLSRQMEKLGVRVILGTEAYPEMIKSMAPEVVIVATGSEPFLPPIKGADLKHVVNVWDVLQERVEVGDRVLIVDGGESFWQCCGTADFLLEKGKKVEIVSYLYFIGASIPAQSLTPLYQRLLRKGAILTPSHRVKEILSNSVVILNVHTNESRVIQDVDTVVLATGNRARDGIYNSLRREVQEIYAIGDCIAPRKVHNAIREGHFAGRMI